MTRKKRLAGILAAALSIGMLTVSTSTRAQFTGPSQGTPQCQAS